ncbi:MAG: PASTA domain-containing protein [Antricoccus sp.]
MSATTFDPMVGAVLEGRYRVIGRLASGGMSKVYVGHDERLDRPVAIKIMNADLAHDPAFITRFTREARAAAGIWHPNVVTVHDQGTDQDTGAVYLVMELVRGATLRAVLREYGRLSAGQALAVIEPLLTGLAAAHREGLVHRDIKPENILIDQHGRLLVVDFGLARAVAESAHTTHSGMGGSVFGTIAYLSPEQVARGYADSRSDVYAVGILLYELLTGEPPYRGDNAVTVAYRHVNDDVPPPSELAPEIPGEVDDLVIEATNRDPLRRPADAAQMLASVHRAQLLLGVADEPVPTASSAATLPPYEPTTTRDDVSTATNPLASRSAIGYTSALTADVDADSRTGHTQIVPRQPIAARAINESAELPEPSARRRRRWPWLVAVILVVVLGAGSFWWFQYGRWTKVPDFAKATSAQQVQDMAGGAGLRLNLTEPQFSETVPSGAVISIKPKSGTRLPRGSDLSVVLSKGPERYKTSSALIGQNADQVLKDLASQFGDKITITTDSKYDDTNPKGTISSFNPPPGTAMKPGSSLTVIVSLGKAPIPMPDVTSQSPEAASAALTQAGFVPSVSGTQEFSDTVPAGAVSRTDPPVGTQTQPGSTVSIIVSKGQDLVVVPDVVKMSSAAATKALQDVGFKVQKKQFFVTFDLVADQDPKGGAKAKRGSTITISVT